MSQGQLFPAPGSVDTLIQELPWYAETRPRAVVKPGSLPGRWAAGPTPEGRVRWLFESERGLRSFRYQHGTKVLIAGYLGPLETEARAWR